MPPYFHIPHAKERAAIVRLSLTLSRISSLGFFPGQSLAEGYEVWTVAGYVFLGTIDGRPVTVSKLARATGLSRATVRRRLAELIKLRYAKRDGRYYCSAEGINLPNVEQITRRQAQLVALTAKEVAKLVK